MSRTRRLLSRLRSDKRGVAAVEFVLVAPIMVLVFAGAADVGIGVMTRMQINEAMSAAANSALVSGPGISAANADATATSLAAILRRARGAGASDATIRISYNGARTYDFVGGRGTSSGPTSAVAECRCPTLSGGNVVWGSAVACDTACPDKSLAARYVSIGLDAPHTALFPQFGFFSQDQMNVRTLVRIQ